ncbi:hypothetical protein [Asticcacaulis taihuensis]|jgi:hypothetical protein|uniref:hypothetical protein n=1 Tax=Asticcacaulis taihuensis TaxID=260084 RepID=UPI0026EA17BC|nr:hypothetical protein [Asticcacaulis taihuensis]
MKMKSSGRKAGAFLFWKVPNCEAIWQEQAPAAHVLKRANASLLEHIARKAARGLNANKPID